MLRIAAAAEVNSNHPIAKSIVVADDRLIDESTISNYTEIAAHGIQATIEGRLVLAGNDRLMHRENIEHNTCDVEGTVVHLAVVGGASSKKLNPQLAQELARSPFSSPVV